MPIEGVVNALRNIHAALVPGGLLIDTQPISARPAVEAAAGPIGSLDMREWVELIGTIDAQLDTAIDARLWQQREERWFVVSDTFESGANVLDVVTNWVGTHIPKDLSQRLRTSDGLVRVHQDVRMRVFEALPILQP
jgi:hypothetical protein